MELNALPCDAPLSSYEQQAATLLRGWQSGDATAIRVMRSRHPKFLDDTIVWLQRRLTDDEARAIPIDEDDAKLALARWYDYRMMAHVLEPKPRLYAVRTHEGRIAKVQLLGYYCPQMRAGCVTLRWAFVPAGE